MESHVTTNPTGPFWTDEKHLHFLKSIETSFVRTMFQNNNNNLSRLSQHLLRLDRYLPDSSESTLDLQYSHRRTRKRTSLAGLMGSRKRMNGRRLRRRSSEAYNSSKDQVVPQVEDDGRDGGFDEQLQKNNV